MNEPIFANSGLFGQPLFFAAVLMPHTFQFVVFCAVGMATTLIDFAVYNLLTRPAMSWRRIPANMVSVSVAMTWAFLSNWFIVFHPSGQDWLPRAERFLVTTAFSAFVLQNLILYFASNVWKAPVNAALSFARQLQFQRIDEDLIARNTCKALAIPAVLIWNFLWYKFFVYAP